MIKSKYLLMLYIMIMVLKRKNNRQGLDRKPS